MCGQGGSQLRLLIDMSGLLIAESCFSRLQTFRGHEILTLSKTRIEALDREIYSMWILISEHNDVTVHTGHELVFPGIYVFDSKK